jgi:hypothetical protein
MQKEICPKDYNANSRFEKNKASTGQQMENVLRILNNGADQKAQNLVKIELQKP